MFRVSAQDVSLKTSPLHEHEAIRTAMLLVAEVLLLVDGQCVLPSKCFVTHVTLERALARMYPLMPEKVIRSLEALPTLSTHIRPQLYDGVSGNLTTDF
jgi:hypothetical protein